MINTKSKQNLSIFKKFLVATKNKYFFGFLLYMADQTKENLCKAGLKKGIEVVDMVQVDLVDGLACALFKYLAEVKQRIPDNAKPKVVMVSEEIVRDPDCVLRYNAFFLRLPECKLFELRHHPEVGVVEVDVYEERLRVVPLTLMLSICKNIVMWMSLYFEECNGCKNSPHFQ